MIIRWRVGAAVSVLGAVGVWTAVSACSSSSSSDYAPPPGNPATDPGCKVISESPPKSAGQTLSAVHAISPEDAGAGDAGNYPDASADAGPDEDAAVDAGGNDAAPQPTVAITPENIRTVACREGTTLDVAAGPNGGLFVAGAGIRAQMITFSGAASETRLVDYLQEKNARARLATLPDGRPYLVGRANERGEVVAEEGSAGPRPVAEGGGVQTFGRAATNAGGSILVPLPAGGALLRAASGETKVIALSERTEALASSRSLVGLGNDEQPFRVVAEGPALVQMGERVVEVDARLGGGIQDAAFTTLGPGTTLPALTLVRGEEARQVSGLEVAIPKSAGDGYVRVVLVPVPTPCPAEPQCNSTCTEENVEVSPKEIAMTYDGARAFVAFVRRGVTRERRYQTHQSSGIVCRFFDCDPSCGSESWATTKKADLVIASVDAASGTVTELFAQPLEVSNGSSDPAMISSTPSMELSAYARDGYLHVAFTGTYQGSFPGVSVFRFRIAP